MRRRSMLIPVAALAAAVAASPSGAAADGNGWRASARSPTTRTTTTRMIRRRRTHILDSLAINVTRTDATPLTAVPGQPLALHDLQLKARLHRHPRRRARCTAAPAASTSSYRGIPFNQEADTVRARSRSAPTRPTPTSTGGRTTRAPAPARPSTCVHQEGAGRAAEGARRRPADATRRLHVRDADVSLAHRYISHTGNSQFPLDAWVTIAASNTVEGVQTLPVKGYWTVNIKDATPGTPETPANYTNDAVTATVPTSCSTCRARTGRRRAPGRSSSRSRGRATSA